MQRPTEENGKPETGNRKLKTGQRTTQPHLPVFRFLFFILLAACWPFILSES
jgi:hypothetical protein